MNQHLVFTHHVYDLVRGQVTQDEIQAPWEKLRDALVAEMRRRALMSTSPSCLGLYGLGTWTQDAIDELATDCYTAVFLSRLPSLAAQLERKANVEGLIFRNIRHFLHELQRKHDPVGFRVFTTLRSAVQVALERGLFSIRNGDPAVGNDTVLSFGQGNDADRPSSHIGGLESWVRLWSEELLPELITARGTALDPVIDRMAEKLPQLADDLGIQAIRFQTLSKQLKDQVRQRWGSLWGRQHAVPEADHELEELAQVVGETSAFEEREAFEKLVSCVDEALEATSASSRTARICIGFGSSCAAILPRIVGNCLPNVGSPSCWRFPAPVLPSCIRPSVRPLRSVAG